MSDWAHAVKTETEEYERQRAVHYAKVSDAETKADKLVAKDENPLTVWCPLRDQFISVITCSRMQSQTRILRKCKQCRCRHREADWSQRLTAARRKADPRDESLGYLKTETYRVSVLAGTKKRKKK